MVHPARRLGPAAVVLVVALLGAVALSACSHSTPAGGSAPSARQAPVKVAIVSDPATIGAFSPPSATVKPGQTVEWSFRDTVPHSVTADGGQFDSGVTSPSGTFKHRFDQPGDYPYHCTVHPQMHGTIVVQ